MPLYRFIAPPPHLEDAVFDLLDPDLERYELVENKAVAETPIPEPDNEPEASEEQE